MNHNPTTRLEAFSDGVFSIAITLLVFSLQVPRDLPDGTTLLDALLGQWTYYLAFVTSFAVIGVMWINHHNLFKVIKRSDHTLMVLNVVLLLVTFINYPTALMAEYLVRPDGTTAALLYNGTFVLLALAFNLLWRYAAHHNRLLDPDADPRVVNGINAQYRFGPLMYLGVTALAALSAPLSLLVNLALAVYFAIPSQSNLFGGD